MLRTIYLRQKDREAYIALTDETGLTAEDCLALAKLVRETGRSGDALAWVERGAELCREDSRAWSARLELTKLQCDLLAAIGRTIEALAIAWGEFERHPSQYTYADLMRFVAAPDRAGWHAKAMEATRSADLHTLIDLLIAVKEIGRLADLIAGTPDQAFKMPATSQQNPRPSPWKNPTRNWPPAFGGPKECGSSMQGKASTTTPPWKTSRVRNVATSVRVSPPSGTNGTTCGRSPFPQDRIHFRSSDSGFGNLLRGAAILSGSG